MDETLAATLRADVADCRRRYTDAGSKRQWARSIGLAAAVGIVYFLAARLSLLLLTKLDGVAVFWPASGVASGVLIALGPRARLPVAAGAMAATIVANLMGDRTLFGAVVFALCNATACCCSGRRHRCLRRRSRSWALGVSNTDPTTSGLRTASAPAIGIATRMNTCSSACAARSLRRRWAPNGILLLRLPSGSIRPSRRSSWK